LRPVRPSDRPDDAAGTRGAAAPAEATTPLPLSEGGGPANTIFAFGVQISTALFTAVLTLVLLRVLGATEYGTFAVALAVGGIVLLPADFGISASTARYLAEAKRSPAAMRATIVTGLRLKVLAGVGVSAVLFLLADPIAALFNDPDLAWPLRGMALAVLGQTLMRFASNCFSARQRNSVSFIVVTIESLAETVASVALVLVGAGAAGAAFGRAIGYGVGAAVGLFMVLQLFGIRLRDVVRTRSDPEARRRIGRYASALLLVDGIWATFTQIDILLIGAILTTTAAGIFQAPVRLLLLVSYPGIALGAAIGPRLARTRPGETVDPAPLVSATRVLLVTQTFAAAVAVAWATPLTHAVLGPGYAQSAAVFSALGPYIVLAGLAPMFSNAIDYVGGTARRLRWAGVALVVNIVLDVILLPRIGVVGAAIGTNVGYAVYVAGHASVASRMLGFSLRPLLASLGRCVLAGTGMAAVLLAGAALGPAGFVFAALLAPLAFTGLLVATGEVRSTAVRELAARGFPRSLLRLTGMPRNEPSRS
jgi:O-antigen/teichoic acid export membrane protein